MLDTRHHLQCSCHHGAQARVALGGKFDDESLKTLFAKIDKDGNGTVDASELQGELKRHGLMLDNSTIQVMMTTGDANGDRKLDFEEFKAAMQKK